MLSEPELVIAESKLVTLLQRAPNYRGRPTGHSRLLTGYQVVETHPGLAGGSGRWEGAETAGDRDQCGASLRCPSSPWWLWLAGSWLTDYNIWNIKILR